MLVWFGQGGRRAWPGTAGLGKQLPGARKAEWAQPTAQHRGVPGYRSGFPGDQGSPLNIYAHKRLLSETRHLAKLRALPSFTGSTPREGPAGACVSPCASEALRTICPAAQSGLRRWHGTWDGCPLSDVVPDGYAAGICGLKLQLRLLHSAQTPLSRLPRQLPANPYPLSTGCFRSSLGWAPGFLIRKERSRLAALTGVLVTGWDAPCWMNGHVRSLVVAFLSSLLGPQPYSGIWMEHVARYTSAG